jgi:DtxR family Mn-dependent transcriptional regulator
VDRYLETIFYIAAEHGVVRPGQVSAWLSVSAPTVSEALRRLERDGWVTLAADRSVQLTASGEMLAADIVRRHRVLERWLTDILGFDWAEADLEAEKMATSISAEVIDRLDVAMGLPATCPHGNTIPGRRASYGPTVALAVADPGTEVVVRRVSELAEHVGQPLLKELARLGIGEGCSLFVTSRDVARAVLTVRAELGSIEVPLSTASSIWVEPSVMAAVTP